jgi:hypothetical protein
MLKKSAMPARVTPSVLAIAAPVHRRNKDIKISLCGTRLLLFEHRERASNYLFGRTITIGKMRGRALQLPDGTAAFVTIHPSFLLRIEDHADKEREYRRFVSDLGLAAKILARSSEITPAP